MNARLCHAAIAVAILTGCATAPQNPIALSETAASAQGGRIGVAIAPLPAPDTYFPGADCLLCYATAAATNSALTTQTKTLSASDALPLREEIAALLKKRGADVKVIDGEVKIDALPDFASQAPNVAPKDYRGLGQQHQIDHLVMIRVTTVGFTRNYASYVPTSDPKATFSGAGYMIDMKTNAYEWYLPVAVIKSADKVLDEPPAYPGLTNAFYQAIEIGRDQFLKPFASNGATASTSK